MSHQQSRLLELGAIVEDIPADHLENLKEKLHPDRTLYGD